MSEAEEQNQQNYTGLKIVVAVLTTLIVVALGLLVYGMARTASNLGKSDSGLALFGTVSATLPADSTWIDTELGPNQLAITIKRADGQLAVLVFDLQSGEPLGTVNLQH